MNEKRCKERQQAEYDLLSGMLAVLIIPAMLFAAALAQ